MVAALHVKAEAAQAHHLSSSWVAPAALFLNRSFTFFHFCGRAVGAVIAVIGLAIVFDMSRTVVLTGSLTVVVDSRLSITLNLDVALIVQSLLAFDTRHLAKLCENGTEICSFMKFERYDLQKIEEIKKRLLDCEIW